MSARALAAALLLLLASAAPAAAQNRIEGSVDGQVEATDNARLAPDGTTKDADQILEVRPSITGALETRGVMATLNYTLNYYGYAHQSDLSRALHDLQANAKLIWWDDLDLEVGEDLAAVPVDFGAPVDNPVNDVQASRAHGKVVLSHALGAANRLLIGYEIQRVDYIKVNKHDLKPPQYLLQLPGASFERDLGPNASAALQYRYELATFDKQTSPATGNFSAHVVDLAPTWQVNDWLSANGAFGAQFVTYQHLSGTKARTLFDLGAKAETDIAVVRLSIDRHVTQDLGGGAADVTMASLAAEYDPTAPWSIGLLTSYGDLHDVASSANPLGSRGYVEGGLNLAYRLAQGTIRVGAIHHQTVDSGPKVVANRFTLGLGGSF